MPQQYAVFYNAAKKTYTAVPYTSVGENGFPKLTQQDASGQISVEFKNGQFYPTKVDLGSDELNKALNTNLPPIHVGSFQQGQNTAYQLYVEKPILDPSGKPVLDTTGQPKLNAELLPNPGHYNPNVASGSVTTPSTPSPSSNGTPESPNTTPTPTATNQQQIDAINSQMNAGLQDAQKTHDAQIQGLKDFSAKNGTPLDNNQINAVNQSLVTKQAQVRADAQAKITQLQHPTTPANTPTPSAPTNAAATPASPAPAHPTPSNDGSYIVTDDQGKLNVYQTLGGQPENGLIPVKTVSNPQLVDGGKLINGTPLSYTVVNTGKPVEFNNSTKLVTGTDHDGNLQTYAVIGQDQNGNSVVTPTSNLSAPFATTFTPVTGPNGDMFVSVDAPAPLTATPIGNGEALTLTSGPGVITNINSKGKLNVSTPKTESAADSQAASSEAPQKSGSDTNPFEAAAPVKPTVGITDIFKSPSALMGLGMSVFMMAGIIVPMLQSGKSFGEVLAGLLPGIVTLGVTLWKTMGLSMAKSFGFAGAVALAVYGLAKLFVKKHDNTPLPGGTDPTLAAPAPTPAKSTSTASTSTSSAGSTSGNGATASTNTTPAASGLASWWNAINNPNVYAIVSITALAGIGLDLSITGPSSKTIAIPASSLMATRNALQASIDPKYQLPSVETGVIGKFFVQDSGNNDVTPSKVVYVSPSIPTCDANGNCTKDGDFTKNIVSVDYNAVRVDSNKPTNSQMPFFFVDPHGAVLPISQSFAALTAQSALAAAGDRRGGKAIDHAAATRMASFEGRTGRSVAVTRRSLAN